MRVSSRFSLVPFVVLAHAALAGCSTGAPPAEGEAVVEDAPLALEAEIGPEGGVLVGQAMSVFRGVKLEIPAGALAKKTKVTLVPSIDATPLPEAAVRVGPEVTLDGALAFDKPVRLTLPVGHDFLPAIAANDGRDVKVWLRDGEGYRLVEPLATTKSSITIETTTIRSAAAGLKLQIPTTKGCGPIGCAELVACTDTSGMCLGEPIDLPFSSFGGGAIGMFRPAAYADGTGEAFTFHTGTANGTVGKLVLPANRATFSNQVLPSAAFFNETGLSNSFVIPGKLVNGVAGDASQVVIGRFAMTPTGATTPPTTGPAPQAVTNIPSRGSVTLGDGRTVIVLKGQGNPFVVASIAIRTAAGQTSTPIALAGPSRSMVGVVADPSRPDAFWMVSQVDGTNPVRIDRFDANGNVLATPALPTEVARRLVVQQGGSGQDAFDVVTPTGIVATKDGLFLGVVDLAGASNPTQTTMLRIAPDGAFDQRGVLSGGISSVRELDADRDGNLWMRVGENDGSTGLVFFGKGASERPKVVPLDPNLFVHEIFPSADRGVWIEVRALTSPPNTPRPLRLVKVRPSLP